MANSVYSQKCPSFTRSPKCVGWKRSNQSGKCLKKFLSNAHSKQTFQNDGTYLSWKWFNRCRKRKHKLARQRRLGSAAQWRIRCPKHELDRKCVQCKAIYVLTTVWAEHCVSLSRRKKKSWLREFLGTVGRKYYGWILMGAGWRLGTSGNQSLAPGEPNF